MPIARIKFTRHAQEMLAERRLERAWVELTITKPESVVPDPNRPNLVRAFRRVPERGGLWLRVVYESIGDTQSHHRLL
jgi:Domain of unknown function (DUF4258)